MKHPDNVWLRDTISACKWLGLAYFFTEDAKYAEQLKKRVYTFFIDGVTGMHPNLLYAQSIPGAVDGRPQVCAMHSVSPRRAAFPDPCAGSRRIQRTVCHANDCMVIISGSVLLHADYSGVARYEEQLRA